MLHCGNQYRADEVRSFSMYYPAVVEEGVRRCTDWFRLRWEECLEVIPVPVVNHILCVSMKFSFLCDVIRGESSGLAHSLQSLNLKLSCLLFLFEQ